MKDTGHRNPMMPGGKSLVDWITPTVMDECRYYGVDMPNERQMAIVISALRMHTIMEHAAHYDQSELGKPDEITKYWPIESSIGRYLKDAARVTLDQQLYLNEEKNDE